MLYNLKLEIPWVEVKEKLKEVEFNLNEEDLRYEKGKEKDLLERVAGKISMNVEDTKKWIESVAVNEGKAS